MPLKAPNFYSLVRHFGLQPESVCPSCTSLISNVNYELALTIGTCHLSLQGLNQVLLQLLIFNTPESSSGWRAEMRHSVLWEKLAEQVFR